MWRDEARGSFELVGRVVSYYDVPGPSAVLTALALSAAVIRASFIHL